MTSYRLSTLPAIRDRLTQGLTDSLHIGAQVYVSVKRVTAAIYQDLGLARRP